MAWPEPRSSVRWPILLRRALLLPVMIAAMAVLTNCAPMPVADDEGNATFAREAIKLLLGRPARGISEVKAVADIAGLLGRGVAAKMLMKETEFVDTWAETLVDQLQLQREEGGQFAAQDKACWGPPTRAVPDPAIAAWVRDHGPTSLGPGVAPQWNMTDLLRSAIALDDLSPFYRAYLFTLTMRRAVPIRQPWVEDVRRDQMAQRLLRVYLNRDLSCMRCHNPTYSASNKTVGGVTWTRLWSIPGHAEKALFGNYYDAGTVFNRLLPILRGDVRKPVDVNFGIRPWGMAASCATDTEDDSPRNRPDASHRTTHRGFQAVPTGSQQYTPDAAGFGSINGPNAATHYPRPSLWQLESALSSGISGLRNGYTRIWPNLPNLTPQLDNYCAVNAVLAANCKHCHTTGNPSGGLNLATSDPGSQLVNQATTSDHSSSTNLRVVPGCLVGDPPATPNPACPKGSELWRRLTENIDHPMPPPSPNLQSGATAVSTLVATYPNAISQLEQWINDGAPHIDTGGCHTSPLPEVDPDEAFAYLTASNLVDGIFMAATGQRLTLAHGYPRNLDQLLTLWDLTENEFLPHSWSLQAVLGKILASTWYARRAPSISQATEAYTLPPILDPWIVADPTDPANAVPAAHQKYNGEGDLVDRFRVDTLLRHVAAALGWKKPSRFPDGGNYPTPLAYRLGQYISPQNPGFKGVNFQSLLALEAETGACSKSGRLPGGQSDWIDALVTGINNFNSHNPSHPISVGEAWSMLKDRLIQDTAISTVLPSGLANVADGKTEEVALLDFLRTTYPTMNLSASAGALSLARLDDFLREACGILVKSPHFVLTNITPYSPNALPTAPRLEVCLPGEPCGYAPVCQHWRDVLRTMGQSVRCLSSSVAPDPSFYFSIETVLSSSFSHNWAGLTRHATGSPGQLGLSGAAPPVPRAQPPKAGAAIERAPPRPVAQFDLIKSVRANSTKPLRGLDRVSQRFATLCPGGLCGFVSRPAPNIARCLENPQGNACLALFPPCDPRGGKDSHQCGALPSDFSDSGVLALWAEGAEVKETANARLLRSGAARWLPLPAGVTLAAGDMIYLPLAASLRLLVDNVVFGDTRMEETQIFGLTGHLLAITGASAESLLERRPAPGAMSPAEIIRGVKSGAFESRVMTAKDWETALGYAVRPASVPTKTEKEIRELNSHFESLHHGFSTNRPK